jgi:hypothetical protein
MPFSLQVIYQGRGWKEGEIAKANPDGHIYLEHESKKEWKNAGGKDNEFNNNFVIIYVTDKDITDKEVWGYCNAPFNLLSTDTQNLRRYKINMSDNKKLYRDLKKDGEMYVLWEDIAGDIVDQKGAI